VIPFDDFVSKNFGKFTSFGFPDFGGFDLSSIPDFVPAFFFISDIAMSYDLFGK
jgi:hypothetical protein